MMDMVACTRCGALSTGVRHICSNVIIKAPVGVTIPEYSVAITVIANMGYKAEILELPMEACYGTTIEEAIGYLTTKAAEWLSNARLSGLNIPKPFNLNMQYHNPAMRTICEVLREIHQLSDDKDVQNRALEAIIMAKKMDAKLRQYKKDYDVDGWWERIDGMPE